MNEDIGTASAQGSLEVIEKIHRLKIFVEGIKNGLSLSLYAVQVLAHQLHLGQAFLQDRTVDRAFRPEETQEMSKLVTRLAPLYHSTVESKIQQVLQRWRAAVLRYSSPSLTTQPDALDVRVQDINDGI